jgi:hypothetical protein
MLRVVYLFGLVSLLFPGLGFAESAPPPQSFHLDLTQHWVGNFSLVVMVVAYISAMLEDVTNLRKSKPMLLAAALIWFVIVLAYQQHGHSLPATTAFKGNLQTYIELLLFIMVSMTYLNAMEDMGIFDALKIWLVSKDLSYRRLFWITGFLVFLISCIVNRGVTEIEQNGVGLGLALCKAIVEAHGGLIQADNRAGKGAEFSIELPLHAPPMLAEPEALGSVA